MTTRVSAQSNAEWVLVAHAARARCFERDRVTKAMRGHSV